MPTVAIKIHFGYDPATAVHGCRIRSQPNVLQDTLKFTTVLDKVTCGACRRAILSSLNHRSKVLHAQSIAIDERLLRCEIAYGVRDLKTTPPMSKEEEKFLRDSGVIT